MFELSNVILLRGVRVYILVKNAKGDMKVMYKNLTKLKSIVNAKNSGCFNILC